LPGPCAAAALEAFNVIEREPERVQKLQNESTIAVDASRRCMEAGVFALPVTFPAVQNHFRVCASSRFARIRMTICFTAQCRGECDQGRGSAHESRGADVQAVSG
jgi:7-keto-8-aminopelargonate synthetase-like enzyme